MKKKIRKKEGNEEFYYNALIQFKYFHRTENNTQYTRPSWKFAFESNSIVPQSQEPF